MGTTGTWGTISVLCAAIALASSPAQADYVISVVDSATGLSSATVGPGQSISLDLLAISDNEDISNNFALPVHFDAPGLEYDSYELREAYADPFPCDLGLPCGTDPFPPAVINDRIVWTAALGIGIQHMSGPIVTFGLTVPADWFGRVPVPDSVTIATGDHDPVLEGIFDGFSEVPSIPGEPFTLNIPEPATLALLAIGGLAVVRRRKNA